MQLLYGNLVWTRDIQTLFHYVSLAKIKEVPLIRTDEMQIKRWWQNGDRMVTEWWQNGDRMVTEWWQVETWRDCLQFLDQCFGRHFLWYLRGRTWMGYGQLWPVMADGGCEMLRDALSLASWSFCKSISETPRCLWKGPAVATHPCPAQWAVLGRSEERGQTTMFWSSFQYPSFVSQESQDVSRCLKSKDSQEVTVACNPGTSILHFLGFRAPEIRQICFEMPRALEELSVWRGDAAGFDFVQCGDQCQQLRACRIEWPGYMVLHGAAWCCMVLHWSSSLGLEACEKGQKWEEVHGDEPVDCSMKLWIERFDSIWLCGRDSNTKWETVARTPTLFPARCASKILVWESSEALSWLHGFILHFCFVDSSWFVLFLPGLVVALGLRELRPASGWLQLLLSDQCLRRSQSMAVGIVALWSGRCRRAVVLYGEDETSGWKIRYVYVNLIVNICTCNYTHISYIYIYTLYTYV